MTAPLTILTKCYTCSRDQRTSLNPQISQMNTDIPGAVRDVVGTFIVAIMALYGPQTIF
jgi:hypothetical protein